MATSKKEALERLNNEDETHLAMMRDLIERGISRYDGSSAVTVTPCGSRKVLDRIKAEYEAVGWDVSYGSDQRDGGWFKLE